MLLLTNKYSILKITCSVFKKKILKLTQRHVNEWTWYLAQGNTQQMWCCDSTASITQTCSSSSFKEHVEEFSMEARRGVQEDAKGVESFSVFKMVPWKYMMDWMTYVPEAFCHQLLTSQTKLITNKPYKINLCLTRYSK